MTAKIAVSKSSDFVAVAEDPERQQQITLARALEDALSARDLSLRYRNEMMEELERFRAAMRLELQGVRARNRRFDARDALAGAGLLLASAGIAVAFHWAYSLIVVGTALAVLGILTSQRPPTRPSPT